MHPILAHRGRLGLYLLAWLPVVPLVVVLLAGRGELDGGEALALAFPLVVVYAYVCLAAWYVVRSAAARPASPGSRALPGISRPLAALATQLAAAVLSGGLWIALGWVWAAALDGLGAFPGLARRFPADAHLLFALGAPLYLAVAGVHYGMAALEASREAEARELAAKVLAREAELRALKARLDPHFLFNSLNAIAALAGSDPAAARRMAILLAEFLRRSLALESRADVPLAEELAHAAAYLAVERVRFGERLALEEAVGEEARLCRVPPLLLQPLVENAVRHGIAQMLEGGVVRIEGRVEAGRLRLAVENPCDPDHPAASGGGVGLTNVAARLTARFGPRARLAVRPRRGTFRVEIEVPVEEEGAGPGAAPRPGEEGAVSAQAAARAGTAQEGARVEQVDRGGAGEAGATETLRRPG